MRMLVVHRHFWPDTPPYASILRAIADRWSSNGADVTVLTAQPSYISAGSIGRRPRTELVDGLLVKRVHVLDEQRRPLGKLLNMIGFPVQIAGKILVGRRPEVVMCSTAPQVLLGVSVSLAAKARRAKFIYHCMDLHPEIGRLSGEFSHPVIYRALMALDTATMRRAASIVVLSDDMRSAVLDRDRSLADRLVVLNNFALPEYETDPTVNDEDDPFDLPAAGTLRIVFTGNIGRFQRLHEVVRGLGAVDREVELIFMGDGHAKPVVEAEVAQLAADSRIAVRFLEHGSPARARALMATAHLGLVSLAPDVVRYAYPSKTATYLCEGLPVLVFCDACTELARTVENEGIGFAASTEDALAAAVTAAADQLIRDGDLGDLSRNAAQYAGTVFTETAALERWQQLVEHVQHDRSAGYV